MVKVTWRHGFDGQGHIIQRRKVSQRAIFGIKLNE